MLPESLVWVSPGRENWQSRFGAAEMYCCDSNSCPLMGPAPCSTLGAQQRASPWPVKSGVSLGYPARPIATIRAQNACDGHPLWPGSCTPAVPALSGSSGMQQLHCQTPPQVQGHLCDMGPHRVTVLPSSPLCQLLPGVMELNSAINLPLWLGLNHQGSWIHRTAIAHPDPF